jgi:hypothetical protein
MSLVLDNKLKYLINGGVLDMNADKFKKKLRRIKKQGEQYKIEKELRDAYAEYWPDRKKRKVSNVMLTIIVIAVVGYVIASFWLQYVTGIAIDPTITTCWFAFWTVEVVSLASIRNNKTKHGDSCENNIYE